MEEYFTARKFRLFRPVQGATMKARKTKKAESRYERDTGTLQYGDEAPVCVMLPVRVMPGGGLQLPEEATTTYARRVHLKSGRDVARGHVAYYHNGRRQAGKVKYYWSLLDQALKGVRWNNAGLQSNGTAVLQPVSSRTRKPLLNG